MKWKQSRPGYETWIPMSISYGSNNYNTNTYEYMFSCIIRHLKVVYEVSCFFLDSDWKYWWIDFNGISNGFSLFYVESLGNHVHCMFICIVFFLLHTVRLKKYIFLKRSIWRKDRKQTGTTTACLRGSGGNDYDGILHTPPRSRNGASSSDEF